MEIVKKWFLNTLAVITNILEKLFIVFLILVALLCGFGFYVFEYVMG